MEHAPASVDEAAEVLARAARDRSRLAFVGGGTELGLGRAPEAVDAIVRTTRMARILEHAPDDLVLVAEAGVPLAVVQEAAGAHGQMLALDPPRPERATIGGLVATGGYGPRRARYGAVRDLILGVTLIRADGVVARGGGKVVKNVAGYDLPKLLCGSLGTLGLIACATFRLHPRPEASATALVARRSPEEVVALVRELARAQLEPASVVALSADGDTLDVGVRFEGFERGVRHQLERLAAQVACERLADDRALWARHDAVRTGGTLRLRLAALPSRLPALSPLVARLRAPLHGAALAWYATLGLGFVGGEVTDVAATIAAIEHARAALVAGGGSLVVEEAPAAVRAAVDPWGSPPAAFRLMAELKARFDPDRRLNPGRFVGGL